MASKRLSAIDVEILQRTMLPAIVHNFGTVSNLDRCRDRHGRTVKQILLARQDLNVLPWLDTLGLPVLASDLDDATRTFGPPLLPRLKALHAIGADLSQQFTDGSTMLHRAIGRFDQETSEVLTWLFEVGVSPTLRDAHGNTALHILVNNLVPAIDDLRHLLVVSPGTESLAGEEAVGPSVMAWTMGLIGPGQQNVWRQGMVVRTAQDLWIERLVQHGCAILDTNDTGRTVMDVLPHTMPSSDRSRTLQRLATLAHQQDAVQLSDAFAPSIQPLRPSEP